MARAWPLSDGYFLAAYAPVEVKSVAKRHRFGLYLVDRFGNKELIYRDPEDRLSQPHSAARYAASAHHSGTAHPCSPRRSTQTRRLAGWKRAAPAP